MFQLLAQAVVNADGLLQALAQAPDLTKVLLQQLSPCSHPAGREEVGGGESRSLGGAMWGVGLGQ